MSQAGQTTASTTTTTAAMATTAAASIGETTTPLVGVHSARGHSPDVSIARCCTSEALSTRQSQASACISPHFFDDLSSFIQSRVRQDIDASLFSSDTANLLCMTRGEVLSVPESEFSSDVGTCDGTGVQPSSTPTPVDLATLPSAAPIDIMNLTGLIPVTINALPNFDGGSSNVNFLSGVAQQQDASGVPVEIKPSPLPSSTPETAYKGGEMAPLLSNTEAVVPTNCGIQYHDSVLTSSPAITSQTVFSYPLSEPVFTYQETTSDDEILPLMDISAISEPQTDYSDTSHSFASASDSHATSASLEQQLTPSLHGSPASTAFPFDGPCTPTSTRQSSQPATPTGALSNVISALDRSIKPGTPETPDSAKSRGGVPCGDKASGSKTGQRAYKRQASEEGLSEAERRRKERRRASNRRAATKCRVKKRHEEEIKTLELQEAEKEKMILQNEVERLKKQIKILAGVLIRHHKCDTCKLTGSQPPSLELALTTTPATVTSTGGQDQTSHSEPPERAPLPPEPITPATSATHDDIKANVSSQISRTLPSPGSTNVSESVVTRTSSTSTYTNAAQVAPSFATLVTNQYSYSSPPNTEVDPATGQPRPVCQGMLQGASPAPALNTKADLASLLYAAERQAIALRRSASSTSSTCTSSGRRTAAELANLLYAAERQAIALRRAASTPSTLSRLPNTPALRHTRSSPATATSIAATSGVLTHAPMASPSIALGNTRDNAPSVHPMQIVDMPITGIDRSATVTSISATSGMTSHNPMASPSIVLGNTRPNAPLRSVHAGDLPITGIDSSATVASSAAASGVLSHTPMTSPSTALGNTRNNTPSVRPLHTVNLPITNIGGSATVSSIAATIGVLSHTPMASSPIVLGNTRDDASTLCSNLAVGMPISSIDSSVFDRNVQLTREDSLQAGPLLLSPLNRQLLSSLINQSTGIGPSIQPQSTSSSGSTLSGTSTMSSSGSSALQSTVFEVNTDSLMPCTKELETRGVGTDAISALGNNSPTTVSSGVAWDHAILGSTVLDRCISVPVSRSISPVLALSSSPGSSSSTTLLMTPDSQVLSTSLTPPVLGQASSHSVQTSASGLTSSSFVDISLLEALMKSAISYETTSIQPSGLSASEILVIPDSTITSSDAQQQICSQEFISGDQLQIAQPVSISMAALTPVSNTLITVMAAPSTQTCESSVSTSLLASSDTQSSVSLPSASYVRRSTTSPSTPIVLATSVSSPTSVPAHQAVLPATFTPQSTSQTDPGIPEAIYDPLAPIPIAQPYDSASLLCDIESILSEEQNQ